MTYKEWLDWKYAAMVAMEKKGRVYGSGDRDNPWYLGPPKEAETLQTIKAAPKVAGYNCKKCNEFCEFTEPNQPDGTFVCFGCR